MLNSQLALKALHASLNGFYVRDLKAATHTFINAQYTRLTGYTLEQLVAMQGHALRTLFHPDDRARMAAHMAALAEAQDEDVLEIEYRFRRLDGEWIWCLSRDSVLERDADGTVRCIMGTFLDITERKRAEEAVRCSESRYRELVQNVNSAIIRWKCDGTITFFNDYAEALFGYRAQEALGRHVGMLVPQQDSAGADGSSLVANIVAHPERHKETVDENVCRDGRRIWMLWTNRPVLNEQGQLEEIMAIGSDISPLKAAEAKLQEANQRKSVFLQTLAHELHNPLVPIRSGLEALRRSSNDRPLAEHTVKVMYQQVCHMVLLVDNLLDITRITRGQIVLHKEPTELREAIRSAMEANNALDEVASRKRSLKLPFEPLRLQADPVRLAQIIGNLVSNAVKYTEEGGQIWITAGRDGNHARISVRDDGKGIAPEDLHRVFKLFAQVYSGRSAGLGIGLALTRALVELHGGSIEARSRGIGQGSEFIVRLPMTAQPRTSAKRHKDGNVFRLSGHRLLVIDDNRDAANSLGQLLEILGAEVQVEYDGASALERVATFRPTAVFLDISMPGMDGYEVARRIRAGAFAAHTLLVAITGWGQKEDRRRAKAAGFDHHFVKPIDINDLKGVLTARRRIEPRACN